MKFTDEDLKRLKEKLHEEKGFTITMRDETMRTLLTRLEAAENSMIFHGDVGSCGCRYCKAWLMACGHE